MSKFFVLFYIIIHTTFTFARIIEINNGVREVNAIIQNQANDESLIMLVFSATYCSACRVDEQNYVRAHDEYNQSNNNTFIFHVEIDKTRANETFARDENIRSVPTHYLLKRISLNGRVNINLESKFTGMKSLNFYRRLLNQ